MIKHTVTDLENGIEVQVVLLNNGKFSVVMKDLGCDEILPQAAIYPSDRYDDAVAYANNLLNNANPVVIPIRF